MEKIRIEIDVKFTEWNQLFGDLLIIIYLLENAKSFTYSLLNNEDFSQLFLTSSGLWCRSELMNEHFPLSQVWIDNAEYDDQFIGLSSQAAQIWLWLLLFTTSSDGGIDQKLTISLIDDVHIDFRRKTQTPKLQKSK